MTPVDTIAALGILIGLMFGAFCLMAFVCWAMNKWSAIRGSR